MPKKTTNSMSLVLFYYLLFLCLCISYADTAGLCSSCSNGNDCASEAICHDGLCVPSFDKDFCDRNIANRNMMLDDKMSSRGIKYIPNPTFYATAGEEMPSTSDENTSFNSRRQRRRRMKRLRRAERRKWRRERRRNRRNRMLNNHSGNRKGCRRNHHIKDHIKVEEEPEIPEEQAPEQLDEEASEISDGEDPELSDEEAPELPDVEETELPDEQEDDAEETELSNEGEPELPDEEGPKLPDVQVTEDGQEPELPDVEESELSDEEEPEISDVGGEEWDPELSMHEPPSHSVHDDEPELPMKPPAETDADDDDLEPELSVNERSTKNVEEDTDVLMRSKQNMEGNRLTMRQSRRWSWKGKSNNGNRMAKSRRRGGKGRKSPPAQGYVGQPPIPTFSAYVGQPPISKPAGRIVEEAPKPESDSEAETLESVSQKSRRWGRSKNKKKWRARRRPGNRRGSPPAMGYFGEPLIPGYVGQPPVPTFSSGYVGMPPIPKPAGRIVEDAPKPESDREADTLEAVSQKNRRWGRKRRNRRSQGYVGQAPIPTFSAYVGQDPIPKPAGRIVEAPKLDLDSEMEKLESMSQKNRRLNRRGKEKKQKWGRARRRPRTRRRKSRFNEAYLGLPPMPTFDYGYNSYERHRSVRKPAGRIVEDAAKLQLDSETDTLESFSQKNRRWGRNRGNKNENKKWRARRRPDNRGSSTQDYLSVPRLGQPPIPTFPNAYVGQPPIPKPAGRYVEEAPVLNPDPESEKAPSASNAVSPSTY